MISFRRTRAVFIKECRHILRDVRSLIMALAVPLLMLLLFGFALSLDVDRIPTLIYDADRTAASRELIERLAGSPYFDIKGYVDTYRPIEAGIDRGTVLMGVAIPRDYGKRVAAGDRAEVQILIDGSDSNSAAIAMGYVESLVGNYSFELRSDALSRKAGRRFEPPIDPRLRVWYNSTLQSRNYVVPGLIAVIIMIIAALLTSLTIAREWEMGSMEQLLSTPLRPSELVAGKMFAFFLLGVADMLMAVGVGVLVFGVPLRGSIVLLAGTASVFLFGALFWGIFISAATRSQLMAYQIGLITSFLPAFLLSGFVYAIENMPAPIQVLSHIFPSRYFVTILKGIFLKGVGLEVLWPQALALVIYMAVVFMLATSKLRQRIA
ncbi:MAG TPA: ABC transporter permease [Bryobacteraceae bacterium]|nr:ABC transporter permease [Bryobacteraceae bacterium]